MCDIPDNNSDHHPIRTSVRLHICTTSDTNVDHAQYDIPKFPRIDWSNVDKCNMYHENLCNIQIPMIDPDSISTVDEAARVTNSICQQLTIAMHDACGQVNTSGQSKYKGRFKPNSWWNADCLVTRDRQRFWYRIWRSCDRPRTGHVYDCYKAAKKAYRAACRQASNSSVRRVSQTFTSLYRSRHVKQFWNMVRRVKRENTSDDDISIHTLHEHFNEKFCNDGHCDSGVYREPVSTVEEIYTQLKSTVSDNVMSESMLNKYIT